MTIVDEAQRDDEWGGRLYRSPLGPIDFQIDGTVETYLRWTEGEVPSSLLLYDTGLGKTAVTLNSLALAFEDDLIDVAIVFAEKNKIHDWSKVDFSKFTRIDAALYAGSPARRRRILDEGHQALVMTYSTAKVDVCGFEKRKRTEDRFLLEYLRGKRVALCFDEFSVLGSSRTSQTYMAFEHLLRELRRKAKVYSLGLTATTVDSSPANHFNVCRLLAPTLSPTVERFEADHVESYDFYGNPKKWRNLSAKNTIPGMISLADRYASITSRKRKTDPDVIEQFPSKIENPTTMVDLNKDHRDLYEHVEEIYADPELDDKESRQGWILMRLLANHPAALISSQGEHARNLVEAVGPDYLRGLEVAKVEAMLAWQKSMVEQQTVVFTFYGQSVLPLLQQALISEGYEVSVNHGQMASAERQRSQDRFRGGETQIFLSSDAGARGLNLGVGSGLLHYEVPGMWSIFEQRSNRIHRIDSRHPSVTIDHLLARHTVEEGLLTKMLNRNDMDEQIKDSDYVEELDPSDAIRAYDRIRSWREQRLGIRPT